jgi:hypothetical protein
MRDILSYLLPGFIELYLLASTTLNDRTLQSVVGEMKSILGASLTTALVLGISYIVGYVVSTLMFYARSRIGALQRPRANVESGPREQLAALFGEWTSNANPSHLSSLCISVLQILHPQLYFEKIERRIILRNLEIGLSGLTLVISLTLVGAAHGWHRLWSVGSLLLMTLLLRSSRQLDGAIDRLAFNLFYTAAMLKKQGWVIVNNPEALGQAPNSQGPPGSIMVDSSEVQ